MRLQNSLTRKHLGCGRKPPDILQLTVMSHSSFTALQPYTPQAMIIPDSVGINFPTDDIASNTHLIICMQHKNIFSSKKKKRQTYIYIDNLI